MRNTDTKPQITQQSVRHVAVQNPAWTQIHMEVHTLTLPIVQPDLTAAISMPQHKPTKPTDKARGQRNPEVLTSALLKSFGLWPEVGRARSAASFLARSPNVYCHEYSTRHSEAESSYKKGLVVRRLQCLGLGVFFNHFFFPPPILGAICFSKGLV